MRTPIAVIAIMVATMSTIQPDSVRHDRKKNVIRAITFVSGAFAGASALLALSLLWRSGKSGRTEDE